MYIYIYIYVYNYKIIFHYIKNHKNLLKLTGRVSISYKIFVNCLVICSANILKHLPFGNSKSDSSAFILKVKSVKY